MKVIVEGRKLPQIMAVWVKCLTQSWSPWKEQSVLYHSWTGMRRTFIQLLFIGWELFLLCTGCPSVMSVCVLWFILAASMKTSTLWHCLVFRGMLYHVVWLCKQANNTFPGFWNTRGISWAACIYVCKVWAIKLAPAPQPSTIYCATPTASPLLILHSRWNVGP
jgi:hypothetical protein